MTLDEKFSAAVAIIQKLPPKVFLRNAWKALEGTSQDEAKQRYIDLVKEAFQKASTEINIDEWLSGDELDPSIKENLAKINS